MASSDRSLDVVAFVTDHFRDIVRRRLSELAGLALITCGLLGVIALATWSVQDPSLSHATQTPVKNLLGFPGAIFSDLAMQLLGLASVMLLLPEALLGWRLLSHRPLGEKWRGLVWVAATVCAAAFVSTLPRIGSWPLPSGLGGACGDALLMVPAMLFSAPLAGLPLVILSVVFGLATVVTLAIATGFTWRRREIEPAGEALNDIDDEEIDEEDDADRGSPMLGMIVHALLSWKARIGRILRGAMRAPLPEGAVAAAKGPRHEPRFDNLGRVNAPSMAPDEDEEEYEEEDEEPTPRRRAAAPKAASRKSGSGFALPSLNFLTAQKASERPTLS
jgi:S-DNA-T family DNA segregation ATPase FtsK/SpoIIIE